MTNHLLPKPPMLTQNIDQLRHEVAAHVAADTIIQGTYWNDQTQRGCFIGCLAKCSDPLVNERQYGLPVMLQRVAESIFEALPADDAKAFFAALPEAIDCDGKDLTRVVWQFLATNLRSLSNCPAEIQAVIDPVIAGMDLLASGQEWNIDAAKAAGAAAAAIAGAASYAAAAAAIAALAALDAARAAALDADAAKAAASNVAYAAKAARNATAAYVAARLRQRNLLLRLISEAPVVKAH